MSNDYTLKRANNFIKNNKVVKDYYPKFNFAAPIGWINDPNGVSIFNDELHLFYQHYPYDSVHGKMHWGHAKTKDGINWEHLKVALAPDQFYDKDGVFSGSAIEKDGKLYLMYTGHIYNDEGEIRENQNIAFSEDGINFEKYEQNPVLDEHDVPKGTSIVDFRDPKVFERNNNYYMVLGSKTTDEKGQVLLYESKDLLDWKFKSVILPYNKFLGDMVECPDLIFFEEKDVFLLSAMNYTDEETEKFYPHISWLIEGKIDWERFVFEVDSVRKMDGGFDFYAPQTTLLPSKNNEYLAIAWQQAWNRTLPTHDKKHKWAGQMTIPRILKEENEKIMQYPSPDVLSQLSIVKNIKKIDLKDRYQVKFNPEYISFTMKDTDQIKLILLNDNHERVTINFDGLNKLVKFSRKETITITDKENKSFDELTYPIAYDNNDVWEVKIFADTSSVQIFINDYYTLTSTFYSEKPLDTLLVESDNNSVMCELKLGTLTVEGNE